MAKEKVLIVEDDPSISNLYKTKLSGAGYDVSTAENGVIGLQQAEKNSPDIILLDVMMPVMNGFEMLKKLRSNKKFEDTPVIILSNYGEVDQMTEGFTTGATDYLIKAEHTPSDVLGIVEDTLAGGGNLIGKAFAE
jgi:DNA-binding response OmpR family regulator